MHIRYCCDNAKSTRGERYGEMSEYSRAEERYIPQYGLVNFFSTVSEPSRILCPAQGTYRRFAISLDNNVFKFYLCSAHATALKDDPHHFKTKGEAYAQLVTKALSPD
jgi:hypothetical protein